MRKILYIGSVIVAVAILLLWFRRPQEIQQAEPTISGKQPATPVLWRKLKSQNARSSTKTARVLNQSELVARFHLSSVDRYHLNVALQQIGDDLMERRGLSATTRAIGPKEIAVELPGVAISLEDLESVMLTRLGTEVGLARAIRLWDDPDARQSMLASIHFDWLSGRSTYTVTRIQDEHLDNHGIGSAVFRVEGSLGDGAVHITWEHLPFTEMPVTGIGWNAMATGPAGFYRSEQIKGVASRGAGLPTVEYDADTGRAIIRNANPDGTRIVFDAQQQAN